MKTFVATKNLGKLDEMRAIFAGSELELDTYPLYAEAPEEEDNYAGNAMSKARSLHEQLRDAGVRGAVLADDSGIEVAALAGARAFFPRAMRGKMRRGPPGAKNCSKNSHAFPREQRAAKFCCAMVLILEGGEEFNGYGEVEGAITREEHGRFGFGYDPLFFYEPPARRLRSCPRKRRTASVIGAALRMRCSHRTGNG